MLASLALAMSAPGAEDFSSASHVPEYVWQQQREHERALIHRLRSDDTAALAELIESYTTRLVRFANHAIHSWDIAEDVVQAVFIHLWERRRALDPERSLKPYLFKAIRNRILDIQKSNRVRHEHALQTMAVTEADPGASHVPSPEATILTVAIVQAAVDQLPERRRLALRLRLEEELTHAEIAAVLDLSPAAAQSLVARALADLRELLRPYFPERA